MTAVASAPDPGSSRRMKFWLATILALAMPLAAPAAGKKSKSFLITVHVEGTAEEAPKFSAPVKLGSEGRQYYFKRVPEFTDDDIAYFYPFISKDGKSYGVGFKLKNHASETLKGLCLTNPGKLLGVRIPNAPYTALLIDRPIDDGVIVVWDGLTKQHLKAFENKFPHADQAIAQAPGGGVPLNGPLAPGPARE